MSSTSSSSKSSTSDSKSQQKDAHNSPNPHIADEPISGGGTWRQTVSQPTYHAVGGPSTYTIHHSTDRNSPYHSLSVPHESSYPIHSFSSNAGNTIGQRHTTFSQQAFSTHTANYTGHTGVNRAISSHTLSGREVVLSERVIEHEVKVPKRVIREDVIEKVIVIPEKIVHEDVVEETQKVREKIIEVARPIYQEKIVEVPEIEYVEKIVEVAEKIIQEKIREVPRMEVQERIIEVPKIITQEKVVEVPEIEYKEVPYEKIVEVAEVREQIVVKEVPVPQHVEKPVPEYVTIEVPHKVERNIPVPVEAVTTFEYGLPKIRPNYKKVTFPIYVPRFVEVPVPDELLSGALGQQAAHLAQHVSLLTNQTAPSLCEIENIAADIKKMDLATHIASADYHAAIQSMWTQGKLQIVNSVDITVPRPQAA